MPTARPTRKIVRIATVRVALDRAACQYAARPRVEPHRQVDVAHDDDEGLPTAISPVMATATIRSVRPWEDRKFGLRSGGEDEDDEQGQADGQLARAEQRERGTAGWSRRLGGRLGHVDGGHARSP